MVHQIHLHEPLKLQLASSGPHRRTTQSYSSFPSLLYSSSCLLGNGRTRFSNCQDFLEFTRDIFNTVITLEFSQLPSVSCLLPASNSATHFHFLFFFASDTIHGLTDISIMVSRITNPWTFSTSFYSTHGSALSEFFSVIVIQYPDKSNLKK